MKRSFVVFSLALLVLSFLSSPAFADVPGAIFTTDVNGEEVNLNIFLSKDLVYLDGGPGPHAPQGAAGLPDGIYVFQVTDPSGKTLLSTDPAKCRRFTVSAGIIVGVVVTGGCEHLMGNDIDHGARTVQLMPFLDTPNNGGEYKAWATPVDSYLAGCDILGVSNGLDVVDCGYTGGLFHGFIPADSKTDNFKVRETQVTKEIDTRFNDSNFQLIVGKHQIWQDTLGVRNPRFSEVNPVISNGGWAHVENPETGVHYIDIQNQPGCTVSQISVYQFVGNKFLDRKSVLIASFNGPALVPIQIKSNFTGTITVYVSCN